MTLRWYTMDLYEVWVKGPWQQARVWTVKTDRLIVSAVLNIIPGFDAGPQGPINVGILPTSISKMPTLRLSLAPKLLCQDPLFR